MGGRPLGGVLLYAGGRDSATPAIDPEVKKMWRIAGLTGAVGLEVAAAIAIGSFGGQWLDRKFGTTPIITIIGFLAGVGAAIKALVRVTRDYKRNLEREDQETERRTKQRNPQIKQETTQENNKTDSPS